MNKQTLTAASVGEGRCKEEEEVKNLFYPQEELPGPETFLAIGQRSDLLLTAGEQDDERNCE